MRPSQASAGQTAPAPQPETSPLSVLGWLVICFAVIPLVMGGHGDGQNLLVVGGGMTAVGVILVLIGRARTARATRTLART